MSDILIVGNSHVGALKLAAQAFPGTDLRFFACPGSTFRAMRLLPDGSFGLPEDHSLKPAEAATVAKVNGATTTEILVGTKIVTVGETFSISAVADLLAQRAVDGLREIDAPSILSQAALKAFLSEIAASAVSSGYRTLAGPQTVASVQAPRPSEECGSTSEINDSLSSWRQLLRNPKGVADIFNLHEAVFSEALAEQGVTLVAQPKATIAPNGLTLAEFSRGSVSVAGAEHDNTDYRHMNDRYGQLVLERVIASTSGQN